MVEDRIRKLMAMAEHPNSNPNEAAVAAARAAQLAAEHNLDLEELRRKAEAPAKKFGVGHGKAQVKRADVNAFGALMEGIGRLYGASGCFSGPPGASTYSYFYAGQQHNVELAIKWTEYLWESCKRANTEHARQADYGSAKKREEARRSFRYFFCLKVHQRLVEKLQEMTKPTQAESTSRALAVAHYLVAEYKEAVDYLSESLGVNRTIQTKSQRMLAEAARAGSKAGAEVSLDNQITGSAGQSHQGELR